MAWKKKWPENWNKIKKLNENHILDLFISVPIRDMEKKFLMWFSMYQSVIVANIGFAPQILQKLWASEMVQHTILIHEWKYELHPHAFNLTFLKKHLEFWTENFRAIFLNIKAHMREVSSKSQMVTWRLFWKLGHLSRNDPIASQNIFVIKH